MTETPTTYQKKYTTCSGRDKPLRYPLMTIRSKQWYTKTSRLPNSFVNVSIGRPPLIRSRQHDHRSDGRWSQNFKYIWLGFILHLIQMMRHFFSGSQISTFVGELAREQRVGQFVEAFPFVVLPVSS